MVATNYGKKKLIATFFGDSNQWELAMQWADVLQDQSLQNLPYKIELNEWGQIVMTPASNWHGNYQYEIAKTIEKYLKKGRIISECSIETEAGIKVADVAWCSSDFFQKHGFETPYSKAPELCVEIISPSNSNQQMQEKMALYFNRGAKECWLVSKKGKVRFFDRDGERKKSRWRVDLSMFEGE